MIKKIFSCLVLIAAFVMVVNVANAQTEKGIEKDLELLRRDLRSEKKKLIAMNVPLTEAEATKFWPVYDQYAGELAKHYDEYYAVIKDYAANQSTLTDAQALGMIKRWSKIQVDVAQTRQKYVGLVEKVIPGKKAALFFQIDRRIHSLIDLQVTSEVPLVAQ